MSWVKIDLEHLTVCGTYQEGDPKKISSFLAGRFLIWFKM